MKTANDRILWVVHGTPNCLKSTGLLVHRCSMAAVSVSTDRKYLDPMALDTCRHCGEPLP